MGCEQCKDGDRVPFKKGELSTSRCDAALPRDGSLDPAAGDAGSFEPLKGASYPDGSLEIELDGGTLAVAEGRAFASLETDLDRDGDPDALLLVVEPDGAARLDTSLRLPTGLEPPRTAARLSENDDQCRVVYAAIQAIAPSFAVIDATLACASPPGSAAPETGAKPATGERTDEAALPGLAPDGGVSDEVTSQVRWIVTLERSPRALDRLQILSPGPGRAEGELQLSLRAADQDGDGHPDIVADVQLGPAGGGDPFEVELSWLNRPGGLARDPTEPERSIAKQADRAAWLLKHKPDRALGAAARALFIHDALCRESGSALLAAGAGAGLSCGRSPGAGRAQAVTSAALAAQGDIPAALAAHARLGNGSYKVYPRDRTLADRALDALVVDKALSWRQGPEAGPFTGPPVRRSGLSFSQEHELVVHGAAPFRYDLGQGGREPLPPGRGDLLVRDPTGRFALVDIERSCQGYHLQIVEASRVVGGVVAGPVVSRPLVQARLAPGGLRCRSLPANLRADRGGYGVLGWTGQGVVLHGADSRLLLVPLDAQARAAGEVRELGQSERPPGPLGAGASTSDGRFLALATPAGIALVQRFPQPRSWLLRPEGWSAAGARDLAVSPSGNRIALVQAGRIFIAERGGERTGASEAQPPAPPPATP